MQLTEKTRLGSDKITRVAFEDGVHTVLVALEDLKSHESNRFRKELAALYRPGQPLGIVLSLDGVRMLSSACMGMLVEFAEALAPVGGSIVLCDVPRDIARVLKKLGLHKQLPIVRTVDQGKKLVSANIGVRSGVARGSAA